MRSIQPVMTRLCIVLSLWLAGCASGPAASPVSTATPPPTATPNTTPAPDGSPTDDPVYAEWRRAMVEDTITARGVSDPAVIAAMQTVPRHRFVPPDYIEQAYADHPLPIGYGQTISQPYIVALMTEALELEADDVVLEIGTGSGYQAAVLGEIVGQVYTIEIVGALAERAEAPLLQAQLADGGRLVIPVGPPGGYQELWLIERHGEEFTTTSLGGVAFVPLTREERDE